MSSANKLLQAASGGASDPVFVEDVFHTNVYTGTGSNLNVVNGIDNSGEGGLVWVKRRDGATDHTLYDTVRGATKWLSSSLSNAEGTLQGVTAFNNNGYTLGTYASPSSEDWVGWNFRKQAGFFDVVTYTGNGSHGHLINHDLGCIPGMIWIKRTDTGENWYVYHIAMDSSNPEQYSLRLDTGAGRTSGFMYDGSGHTAPTATQVNLSNNGGVNASGGTFVMYLFAAGTDSDSQIFGEDGDEAVIKCGSFTSDGSGISTVDLGFEPQLLLCKSRDYTDNWQIWDMMRGMSMTEAAQLAPNSAQAETARTSSNHLRPVPTSTGFIHYWSPQANRTWIFMAIRRPMKAPEYGTDVFAASAGGSSGLLTFDTNFRVDFNWLKGYTTTSVWYVNTRITGQRYIGFDDNQVEASLGINWDRMTGWQHTSSGNYTAYFGWSFKRAAKFLDIVTYSGDGASSRNITHNLGVAPELMIVKSRSAAYDWHTFVSALGNNKELRINSTTAALNFAYWGNTTPTSTVFTVSDTGGVGIVNGSNKTYIAYLFATLAGVSKVGSYSGTGSTINVDCGFSAGARFVLIKRTDDTGNWFLYDSVRGIVSGDDPYIFLNETASQVTNTDYIDPLNAGFTVTSSAPAGLNASGGTYIFLAIA